MADFSKGGRVSAVIVHYRTPEKTLRAARAVAQAEEVGEVVVVDNASHDDIGARLAAEVPRARLLAERENRGYGAACNRGVRETSCAYLLFLNSDAYVLPRSISVLVAALDADPGAAAAGPRLSRPDGALQRSILRLPSPWRIFCESSGLALLSGGRGPLRGHTATREDHAGRQPVEALMGAALLVRRKAFDELGGFDEGFFLYAEEVDLMARWRRRGYRVLFEPQAEVIHEGGASGGDLLFGELHASLACYVEKFHSRAAASFAKGVLAAGAAARYAVALLTPGGRGRTRRARYRAALSGKPRQRLP